MPDFPFAYHGGKQPDSPEETEVEIERWRGWFDRIGAAIVGAGNSVSAAVKMAAKRLAPCPAVQAIHWPPRTDGCRKSHLMPTGARDVRLSAPDGARGR